LLNEPQSFVSKCESGERRLDLIELRRICGVVGVTLLELVGRFDTTGRRGVQTKTVTVSIKGAKAPVVLTLVVTIPDLVKLSPEVLFWTKGEAAKSKTIVCDVMPGLPVRILAHHSGMSLGYYGTSHHSLEDLSVMRAIADLTVVCAADANLRATSKRIV